MLLLVFACLNPRPEELPSGVDQTEPVVPALDSPDTELADPVGEAGGDDGARGASPAEEPAANPAAAPPPAPDGDVPPPDAGADAAPDAGAGDEPDAG